MIMNDNTQPTGIDASSKLELQPVIKDIKKVKALLEKLKAIQKLSYTIKCDTIEFFSDKIIDKLESIYGAIPIKIYLRKVMPPINTPGSINSSSASGFASKIGLTRP